MLESERAGAVQDVRSVYVDGRCLQDPAYSRRGIGHHAFSLISAFKSRKLVPETPRLYVLTDPALPQMPVEYDALFDSSLDINRSHKAEGSLFVSPSPMTHDPLKIARFLTNSAVRKIAVFHDLIPLEYPEKYLSGAQSRQSYLICLAWLKKYDLLASNSKHTASELARLCDISPERIVVTGVALRNAISPDVEIAVVPREDREYILVAAGADSRKNPETAIRAYASCQLNSDRAMPPLKIFGGYTENERSYLRKCAADAGGDCKTIQFASNISDEEVGLLYKKAIVTIVPSLSEGFSIPVIESFAFGTPAIASDIPPHRELVHDDGLRFDPTDENRLTVILMKLLSDSEYWQRQSDSNIEAAKDFEESVIQRRFIALTGEGENPSAPNVRRHVKPKLAFLTPLPPAKTGVADYSHVTLTAMSEFADIAIFTNTKNFSPIPHIQSVSSIQSAYFNAYKYDSVVSVLGNSDFHIPILDYLKEKGGAALAHDARMINFYAVLYGRESARIIAEKELETSVSNEDIDHWLHNQHEMPTLFLSEIVANAHPLLVHSSKTADLCKKIYNARPRTLPFAIYRNIPASVFDDKWCQERRKAYGYSDDDVVITSFGFVTPDKAPEVIIWAIKLLCDWGVRVRMMFCGAIETSRRVHLQALCEEHSIADKITFLEDYVPEDMYLDYLAFSDVAIQLRTHFFGSVSGALSDCISVGLPSVANAHLAETMEAPSFVARIPDNLSAVLLAEGCLSLVQDYHGKPRPRDLAGAYNSLHSPRSYAKKMIEALELA